MSNQKAIPKGLCNQENKRGHTKKPPIPYISIDDEIGDKVKGDPRTFKVKIDKKIKINASVWLRGSQEGFLVHVIGALNYCVRMNLFNKWMSAKKVKKDLVESRDYIRMLYKVQKQPDPAEPKKEPEENPPLPQRQEEAQETLPKTTRENKKEEEGGED